MQTIEIILGSFSPALLFALAACLWLLALPRLLWRVCFFVFLTLPMFCLVASMLFLAGLLGMRPRHTIEDAGDMRREFCVRNVHANCGCSHLEIAWVIPGTSMRNVIRFHYGRCSHAIAEQTPAPVSEPVAEPARE